ncbi:MAG: hypothetical protein PHQ66_03395 [Candidatus Nanoarchaeia archaeon]|nr:hypothetical protein [Candidatus Nanoarchaeia archaeon]MDD5357593.1 hypothetical protein [Candidatus Nanoarchaeia archaeon]MDD5588512.1 hypothetical protein [Candidatus Nanoarchaeia archaeon]
MFKNCKNESVIIMLLWLISILTTLGLIHLEGKMEYIILIQGICMILSVSYLNMRKKK